MTVLTIPSRHVLLERRKQRFGLQELPEFLDGQTCIAYDAAESKTIDRVIPRDGQNRPAFGHRDVLTLPD